MYIPPSFAESDTTKLHDFIEQHSFATVVNVEGRVPVASHLPLLLSRTEAPCGRLIGHMARANPQWKQADGQTVLAIFHGPHAYISPTWYEVANAVPTWNYVAVHVHGTFRIDDNRSRRLEIVRRYVTTYEASMQPQWSLDSAGKEFIDTLVDAIVGFEIDIERIEGKWKLNQNHDSSRRAKVVRALKDAGGENREKLADLISLTLEENSP